MANCVFKGTEGVVAQFRHQLALPHRNTMPSHCSQLLLHRTVALSISRNFSRPEIGVQLWNSEVPASFVAMPEAAINKNHSSILAQYYVRVTWQTWMVKTIAEATPEKITAHNQFGLCVPATNRSHAAMTLLLAHLVHKPTDLQP